MRQNPSPSKPKRNAKRKAEDQALDSDALDDSDSTRTPVKPTKKKTRQSRNEKSEEEDDPELLQGQEIIGRVVKAPTTGRVPSGQISQNTFDFLQNLKDPACNDRQWFKLHEPVYRLAEKEWKDFIEALTDVLIEVDPEIPPLPPKDVIHRIYRDVRFSNDKTPYKKGFSASFSRSGRKGIFAGLKPGNESLIAAGAWCPAKNELDTIRANIKLNSRRLRQIISSEEFESYFGEAKPPPSNTKNKNSKDEYKVKERRNIFGMDDELKTAPKGVDKNHPDIDLLKCRSFAVVHQFSDSEVLDPGFKRSVAMVVRVMQPFVHCLNDMMTVQGGEDSESESGSESETGVESGGGGGGGEDINTDADGEEEDAMEEEEEEGEGMEGES